MGKIWDSYIAWHKKILNKFGQEPKTFTEIWREFKADIKQTKQDYDDSIENQKVQYHRAKFDENQLLFEDATPEEVDKRTKQSRKKHIQPNHNELIKPNHDIVIKLTDLDDIDDVLDDCYQHYKLGDIKLGQYREAILEIKSEIKYYKDELRDNKKYGLINKLDYDYEKDNIKDAEEAVRWRLKWVEKKIWSANEVTEAGLDIPENGKWISFNYIDSEGNDTKRSIVMWRHSGAYVTGYDRKIKEERTFRVTRMSNVQWG